MSKPEVKAIARELQTQAAILGGFVAVMWVLEIVDIFVFRGWLNTFGVRPRTLLGLRGILFMPFLHGNIPHLVANTVPFVVLGWSIMLREISDFFVVTAVTMLTGGLGIWLIGAPHSIHIGASGLVFGYFGFLLLRGFFERRPLPILLSLMVAFLYGSIIWGILPSRPGISWEGHLFGFIGGVLAAQLLAKRSHSEP